MAQFPIAPKHPHPITQHGQTRIDEYYWMRRRDDPAVLAYLKAENDYLEELMQHTKPLQEQLFLEMKGRIKEDDSSAPQPHGEYFYYTRNEEGKQYPIYCRKHGSLDAAEEILLDQNLLAADLAFCRIGSFSISPDHNKLAYSVDADGTEICSLYIKNLVDGSLYPEVIGNTYGDVYDHYGVEWGNDSQTLFYVTLDDALRPYKLYRHMLGTDPATDELLYTEVDDTFYLFVLKSRSQAYILTRSHSTITEEWRYLPADEPHGELRVFDARRRGIEYLVEHAGDRFFVIQNENAPNFNLMETPLDATSHENWREVIPHREDVLIEGAEAFENYLALFERKDGLKQIRISGVDGLRDAYYVPFPEPTYDIEATKNPEYKSDRLRFKYASLVTPNSVIDYHMDSHTWELKKQDEIPSGHDPADYVSERQYALAEDGTRVPLSIVYRKGLQKNGRNPALLTGYGSYGSSYDANFNANRFSLIDRGFVFAIAHIRGGSEMGRAWYDNGKMLNKRNSFTDFIACAEHLVAEGFTQPEKLGILGRSAGGLLMGACMTMRPNLFGAVIAEVPFVDVVTTMSDPSIPLTTLEYDQWGNPEDETYFGYMMSYSPYDNIQPVAYPHALITTGLNDPRVAYWEPAKFVARLRTTKTDKHQLFLKTNMDAGHAGASGRYDYLREVAFNYAWLIDRLGAEAAV